MFELSFENADGKIVNINDGTRYVVVEFEGFNPPAASLFASKSPNRKGSRKQGSTLDERALLIQIKILGDVEKNRNALYEWTDTETELKIYYKNGIKNIYCEGTVTDCDVPLCTDNEVMTVAITCNDPYLKDLQEIAVDISNLLKQFTFPFAIEYSETQSVPVKRLITSVKNTETGEVVDTYEETATGAITVNKGIPFSTLRDNNITNVFNAGAETGVLIRVKALKTVSNISLFDGNDATRIFSINMTLQENEVVEIDTERSPRTVKLIRTDGTIENILKYIGHNPTWFHLKKGNNIFAFSASDTGSVEVTFSFTTKYLGV